ncbi:MAG: hypothetical protein K2P80_10355 [Beijerinckiaceae bacterium]|nr:hypothetical protein [Beijerinckiaceae bacterium]
MSMPSPLYVETEPPGLARLGRDPTGQDDSNLTRDVLSTYNSLRAFESDYDKAQGQLRAIASTWLLAGIGAVGVILNSELSYVPATSTAASQGLPAATASILRQLLMFVVSLGMISLWRLDQKVYQNLLHNVFALGYWIEYKYPLVPPTRMLLYHGNNDITDSLGQFYSRPVGVILTCAVLNLLHAMFGIGDLATAIWSWTAPSLLPQTQWLPCAAVMTLHALHTLVTLLASRNWGSLRDLLPIAAQQAKDKREAPPQRSSY